MNALSAAAHLRQNAEWPGGGAILAALAITAIVAPVSLPFAGALGACLATGFVWRSFSISTAWLVAPSLALLAVTGLLAGIELEDAAELLAVASYLGLATAVGIRLAAARQSSGEAAFDTTDRKHRPWDYLVCAVVTLLAAQSWFSTGSVVGFGDFYPLSFTDPTTVIDKVSPLWNSLSSGTGGRNFTIVQIPFVAVSAGLQELGLSGSAAQRILLSLLFTSEALAALFLIRTVWPRAAAPARVAGALFYVFNPLAFYMVPGPAQMLALVLMPLLGGIMLRSLRADGRRGALLWALCSVGLAYVAANPPLALVASFAAVTIPTIVHLVEGGRVGSVARFLARALPMSVLFNLWWLVPALLTLTFVPVSEIPSSPEDWGWTQVRNSIANIFTLNTGWGWNERIYYPYSGIYGSPVVAVAMYLPAIVSFAALVMKKRDRIVLLFAAITLLLMFLSKGIHQPFSEINRFLFENVPGVAIFREPALKLLPAASVLMALLVTASVDATSERLRRGWMRAVGGRMRAVTRAVAIGGVTFVLAAGLALPTAAMPLATGDVVADERPVLPGTHVRVPDFWRDLAGFLDTAPEAGAVVLLPLSDYYQMPYSWGYYGTDGWAAEMIRRPVISGGELTYIASGAAARAARSLSRAVLQGEPEQALWRARSLGARFIVVRDDLDRKVLERFGRRVPRASTFEASLARNAGIELVRQFGPLSLYEVDVEEVGLVTAWEDMGWWPEGEGVPPAGVFSAGLDPVVLTRPGGAPPAAADEDVRSLAASHTPVVSVRRRDLTAVTVPLRSRDERIEGTPILTRRDRASGRIPVGKDLHVQFDSATPQPASVHAGDLLTAFVRWNQASTMRIMTPAHDHVRDGSFEEGAAWSPVLDCARSGSPRAALFREGRSRNAYEGDEALRLRSMGRLACVWQSLDMQPGGSYELSLAFKRVAGSAPRVCLSAEKRGLKGRCISSPPPSSKRGWQYVTETVKVPFGTTDTRLFLYADEGDSRRTVSLYDAVSVRKLEVVTSYDMSWREGAERIAWADVDAVGGRITPSVPQPNVVRNPSFTSRVGASPVGWSRVGDCNRVVEGTIEELGISARVIAQGSDGAGALRLTADHNSGCISQRIRVQAGEPYSLSLSHREISEGNPALCVLVPSRDECLPLPSIRKADGWVAYDARFHVPPTDNYVVLYLYAPASGRGATVNLYDNVQVRALDFEPRPFLALDGESDAAPQIELHAKGGSEYLVTVHGATEPFTLTLNQTYDPGWELRAVGKAEVHSEHLVANGFANAWLMSGPSSFEVVLEFVPERWARWARWASVVAILLCTAVAAFATGRKRGFPLRRGK
jgi:arabinofuranan 3-O-arabinosyltransferase